MSGPIRPVQPAEFHRLKKRSVKFLKFALRHKKINNKLIDNHAKMLASEYQKGYAAKNGDHFLPPRQLVTYRKLTRLGHLKAAILPRRSS